jgi:hypothetical protein
MHKVPKIKILLTPRLIVLGLIVLGLIALSLTMAGCGNSTTSSAVGAINGNWTATLNNADGSIAYQFTATFAQAPGGVLNVTDLQFAQTGSCLLSGNPATGSFTPANRAFGLSMISTAIIGPDLALQGVLSGSTVSGTWNLTGGSTACSGNGTFNMQPSVTG